MSLSHLKIINDQDCRTLAGSKKVWKRVVKIVLTWCNFVVRRALTTHAFSRSQTRIAKQPKSSKVHLLLLSCWSKFWNPLINHFWQVNKKGFMTVLLGLKNKDRVGKNLGKHLWQTEISGQLFDLTGEHNRIRANRNDPLSYFWWRGSIAKFHFWGCCRFHEQTDIRTIDRPP